MNISPAEKIETVVLCFLARGTVAGTLGELVEFEPAHYRVTVEGKTYIVRSTAHGWSVSFKGYQGIDRELYLAARNAMEGGSRRNVSSVAEALTA